MPSPVVIQQLIDNAQVNTTGTIKWEGTGGQKAIETALNQAIRDKGVYFIPLDSNGNPDTTTLQSIGSATARLAIVAGLGIFHFDANSIPPIPAGAFTAPDGLWKLDSQLLQAPSNTAFGAGGLSASINHGLNTNFPSILVFEKSATPTGFPYTEVKTTVNTVVDANNITVTFPAITTSVHLIIVKQ